MVENTWKLETGGYHLLKCWFELLFASALTAGLQKMGENFLTTKILCLSGLRKMCIFVNEPCNFILPMTYKRGYSRQLSAVLSLPNFSVTFSGTVNATTVKCPKFACWHMRFWFHFYDRNRWMNLKCSVSRFNWKCRLYDGIIKTNHSLSQWYREVAIYDIWISKDIEGWNHVAPYHYCVVEI